MKVKNLKNIILLQLIVIIYTFNSIIGKFSADAKVEFLSIGFIAFYAAEVAVLGIYAILWQQMIKRFELSVAYANRAMALLWSALWAVIIFHDRLTWKNILGILFVIAGTIVVNMDSASDEKKVACGGANACDDTGGCVASGAGEAFEACDDANACDGVEACGDIEVSDNFEVCDDAGKEVQS